MVKRIIYILTISTIFLQASQYAIVVNHNSTLSELTPKQIKDLFLMKRHFVKRLKLIPVNATSSLTLRKAFDTKILNMHGERLNEYWIKKHFQGITPPTTQSSERSIKLFVKNVEGAIGYLPLNQIDNDLKVLYEF